MTLAGAEQILQRQLKIGRGFRIQASLEHEDADCALFFLADFKSHCDLRFWMAALPHLASLGPLLGARVRRSPSNPALRILLRAFVAARSAIHGTSQTQPLTPP